MKKLMFAAAVLAAVSFASCGNKEAENTDTMDSANLETAIVSETAVEVNNDTVTAVAATETAVVADQPAAEKK